MMYSEPSADAGFALIGTAPDYCEMLRRIPGISRERYVNYGLQVWQA
jgi:hypothetical protein